MSKFNWSVSTSVTWNVQNTTDAPSKCMTALVPLTFTDLGTCLCAPDGFKFYSAGDKSMLPYIDSYLDKFCDSSRTPICNEETIDMATSTLAKNCDVRVEEIGNFAAFAYLLLKHYPTLREVMCSRPKG